MNPSIFGDDAQAKGAGKLVPLGKERDLTRVVDAPVVLPRKGGALQTEVEQMQHATAATAGTTLRRLLFVWLRIYVHSSKHGKEERVNVGVPIPLIGALMRRHLDFGEALKAVNLAHDDSQAAGRYLESCMALELVRVETDNAERGKREIVVIGLD